VRLQEPDVLRGGLANPALPATFNPVRDTANFINKTLIIAELEVRKLLHDPSDLITRAVQPTLWLVVFGQTFSRIRAIPTGDTPYLDFMAPGILAQSVLFISIFYGIAIIWERDMGILHKFLASPTPRTALVLGKALSAGVRSLSQAVIIFVLAVILGVHVKWDVFSILGLMLVAMLGAALFSTFSLLIACLVKTRERFMGFGQVLTMPLFFASNAIYPIAMMPDWLQFISRINPLTYEVDALRALMLSGAPSTYGVGVDILVLAGITAVLVIIGGKLYPNVAT
jgi:ABC-2 type transport system permease protein